MHPSNPSVDEYTLAAFVAGTLSKDRREEVVAYLADNADTRELLHMACEALQAARIADDTIDISHTGEKPPRWLSRRSDRSARQPASRLRSISMYLAAAVVVIAAGISLRLVFGPPTDALRSPRPIEAIELNVRTSVDDLRFQWSQVPEAYLYKIVIWDLVEARVVTQFETDGTSLDKDNAFIRALRPQLEHDHSYSIRVDAYDAQNRRIRSSNRIDFSLSQ